MKELINEHAMIHTVYVTITSNIISNIIVRNINGTN